MFRDAKGKCSGIQRVRGEDPLGQAQPDGAELKPEDIFSRKVSLMANAMPLKDALAAVARAAQIELQLEAAALKEVGLDVDKPVMMTIKDEPLAEALGNIKNLHIAPGQGFHLFIVCKSWLEPDGLAGRRRQPLP